MKERYIKVKNFLNRDVDEFNKVILSVICITILVVAGIISYTITNSYALFSSQLEGTKTLQFHPTKEYSVYSISSSYGRIGSNVDGGTYTGYCLKPYDGGSLSNSEPNKKLVPIQLAGVAGPENYCPCVYPTQAACETGGNNTYGNGNYTCSNGTWVTYGIDYSVNPNALNSDVYLKYNINANNQVQSTEVCFIYSENPGAQLQGNSEPNKKLTPIQLSGVVGQTYCLTGGDGGVAYSDNKDLLENVFGASNCDDYNDDYECSSGSFAANSDGDVTAAGNDGYCNVYASGVSYCYVNTSGGPK